MPPWMATASLDGPRERWAPCLLTKGKVGPLPLYGKGGPAASVKLERWAPCLLTAGKVGDLPLVQVHVVNAKVPVRRALSPPVAHLLCNRQGVRLLMA